MRLSRKTLEKLRELINSDDSKNDYRSGPKLVKFFNELGFRDSYEKGFPSSRKDYTDSRLQEINGTPLLDKCIKALFAPVNFIERMQELDSQIRGFNRYLAFDKWKVIRNGADIEFQKLDKIEIDEKSDNEVEDEFLRREFTNVDVGINNMGLESAIVVVLEHRIEEIEQCFSAKSYLAVVLLAGSTLEGIFLGLACAHPRSFYESESAPGKQFDQWKLYHFIKVAEELGLIQPDISRFSQSLRYFRNYIHPYEQMKSDFKPRERTAKICLHVLKAVIHEVSENISKIK